MKLWLKALGVAMIAASLSSPGELFADGGSSGGSGGSGGSSGGSDGGSSGGGSHDHHGSFRGIPPWALFPPSNKKPARPILKVLRQRLRNR